MRLCVVERIEYFVARPLPSAVTEEKLNAVPGHQQSTATLVKDAGFLIGSGGELSV